MSFSTGIGLNGAVGDDFVARINITVFDISTRISNHINSFGVYRSGYSNFFLRKRQRIDNETHCNECSFQEIHMFLSHIHIINQRQKPQKNEFFEVLAKSQGEN